MSSTIQILVDNLDYDDTCYAGQTLSGKVVCNFTKEKKLRAVRIRFEGKCNTNWTESEREYDEHSKQKKLKDVPYRAEEIYFIHEYNVAGDGTQFTLPAGTHSYPFSFILPQLLPSSFENNLAKIIYVVKATVDCPWQFDDHAAIKLKLVAPFDLNTVPKLREPIEVSVDKTMFTWSFSFKNSDPLIFNVSLPVGGYASGQQVRIGAYVHNMTHVNVESVEFRISRLMEFITHYPKTRKKLDTSEIVSCVEGGIGAHGEKSWTSVLTIPTDDSYLNMEHCNLINIRYQLQGIAVVPFPHIHLSAIVPIVIGDVPLTDAGTGLPLLPTNVDHSYPCEPPLSDSEHSDAFEEVPSSPSAPQPPTDMPPTYEEAQRQVTVPASSSAPQETKSLKETLFEWFS